MASDYMLLVTKNSLANCENKPGKCVARAREHTHHTYAHTPHTCTHTYIYTLCMCAHVCKYIYFAD